MRDGRVPKLSKNYEKEQKEKQDRVERKQFEYEVKMQEKEENLRKERAKKPLKIKANRREYVANTSTKQTSQPAKQLNVKF